MEKVKNIEKNSQYDIGLRTANDVSDIVLTAYKPTVKTSKPIDRKSVV